MNNHPFKPQLYLFILRSKKGATHLANHSSPTDKSSERATKRWREANKSKTV